MKSKKILYMVMYDITHQRVLQKVAKILQKAGFERINYSVWLGNVNPVTPSEVKEKLQKCLNIPETKGSRLYVLPVGVGTVKKMSDLNGKRPGQLDYWTGERHTQFY
jgi:CRISPR-associated endonuclease Cas2